MPTGDITDYLESGNKFVNVEDNEGKTKKAVLTADAGAIKDTRIVEISNPSVEHFLYQELNDVTILSVSVDGKTVTLAPGHNFVNPVTFNSDYLNIHYIDPVLPGFTGRRFSQHSVRTVTGDVIEITAPISYLLVPANVESSKRVNVNMGVLGTRAAPVKFMTYPPTGQSWALRRFIGDMILTSAGDDGLFGNLARLTWGEYYGFESDIFNEYNLSIFDNGGYRATGFDLTYPTRSGGGGSYGMSFRKTVAGQDKSGVIVILESQFNDKLVKFTQDDLRLIERYRVKIMGNIV